MDDMYLFALITQSYIEGPVTVGRRSSSVAE